jgi:hypothetical protein
MIVMLLLPYNFWFCDVVRTALLVCAFLPHAHFAQGPAS